MLRRVQLGVGFCLYVVSFFLPAIKQAGPGRGLPGWCCAWLSLWMPLIFRFPAEVREPGSLLMFGCGLVNPLLLAYLALLIWPRWVRTRLVIGGLAIVGLAACWTYFVLTNTQPLVGHFVWVAAIAIMLSTELWRTGQNKPERPAEQ